MLKRLSCCLLLVIAIGITLGYAQTPARRGTEFWASFMRNGANSDGYSGHMKLIVSAKEACEITVTNPATGVELETYTIQEPGYYCYEVNPDQCYNGQIEGKADKGLRIVSTQPITLLIANEANRSREVSNVLPIEDLGKRYLIQTNKSIGEALGMEGENRASFLVVATEDGTSVDITPTSMTFGGHDLGELYTVRLEKGQCYQVHCSSSGTTAEDDPNGDFSGTWVESNKPVAVFNGNSLSMVTGSQMEGYGHVFEQAMPVESWGKEFVVIKEQKRSQYSSQANSIKITALEDNTMVQQDNNEPFVLGSGENRVLELSTEDTYLKAERPIAVYLYYSGMAWVAPIEQASETFEVAFLPVFDEARPYNLNVVCRTSAISDFQIKQNGVPGYTNAFKQVAEAEQYSYTSFGFWNPDWITCQCPGGIVAYAYSPGVYDGYAFGVVTSVDTLNPPLKIVGPTQVAMATSFWPGNYRYCLEDSTGIDASRIQWYFKENPEDPLAWTLEEHGASCNITAFSQGERELHVRLGNSVNSEDAFILINSKGFGVDENATNHMEIYPNPTNDEVKIGGCKMWEVDVYNLMGQKLKTVFVDGAYESRVKLGDLPQALYLLEVHTPWGNKTKLVAVIR